MGKYLADSYDAALRENANLAARLAEAERLLGRIDNADAIVIDREYPATAVDEAERIYDDLHEFLTRAADSASLRVDDLPVPDYDVTCARCGKVLSCRDAYIEEGDEWECHDCWKRCEADQPTERVKK